MGKSRKERLLEAIYAVSDDLPDGAYWVEVHRLAGLKYGEAFDLIAEDPKYFGATKRPEAP